MTRRVLLPVVLGALGMGFALLGAHLWVDHQTWHVLLNNLAAQSRAAQKP